MARICVRMALKSNYRYQITKSCYWIPVIEPLRDRSSCRSHVINNCVEPTRMDNFVIGMTTSLTTLGAKLMISRWLSQRAFCHNFRLS